MNDENMCYDSSSNNDHTWTTPCSAYKTGERKPQPERAGNILYGILNLIRGQVNCIYTRKASLSVAGIHGSQDVKTEIVPIAVSAHDKSQPLAREQFYVHEKLKLGDQIVDMQGLNDR